MAFLSQGWSLNCILYRVVTWDLGREGYSLLCPHFVRPAKAVLMAIKLSMILVERHSINNLVSCQAKMALRGSANQPQR